MFSKQLSPVSNFQKVFRELHSDSTTAPQAPVPGTGQTETGWPHLQAPAPVPRAATWAFETHRAVSEWSKQGTSRLAEKVTDHEKERQSLKA